MILKAIIIIRTKVSWFLIILETMFVFKILVLTCKITNIWFFVLWYLFTFTVIPIISIKMKKHFSTLIKILRFYISVLIVCISICVIDFSITIFASLLALRIIFRIKFLSNHGITAFSSCKNQLQILILRVLVTSLIF